MVLNFQLLEIKAYHAMNVNFPCMDNKDKKHGQLSVQQLILETRHLLLRKQLIGKWDRKLQLLLLTMIIKRLK